MRPRECSLAVVVAASLLAGARAAPADDERVLAQVKADWQARQQRIQSIRMVAEGTVLTPRGGKNKVHSSGLTGDVPPEDHTSPLRLTLLMDFRHNWIRKETRGESFRLDQGFFRPWAKIDLYDGAEFREHFLRDEMTTGSFQPGEFDQDLTLQRKEYYGLLFEVADAAATYAAGLLPSRASPSTADRIRGPPDFSDLRVHGYARHGGRECLVLRTLPPETDADAYADLWLDLERDSLPVRGESYDGGVLLRELIIDYRPHGDGWAPDHWTCNFHDEDALLERRELKLIEWSVNERWDRSLFQMEPQPGMIVSDASSGAYYRVGQPGEPDIPVLDLQRMAEVQRSRWWKGWYVLLGLAIVLGLAAGVLAVRRRRAARSNIP